VTSSTTTGDSSVGSAVRTRRWWPAELAALALFGVGALALRADLLALAVVGVGFVAYARAAVGGDGSRLELDRSVSTGDPTPGQAVTVTVTVRNAGTELLPDVRVVDGVPGALAVSDGSPRFATALRAGESYTHSYELTAVRGEHPFDPATAVVESLGGAREREVSLADPTTLTCSPPLSDVPLRSQTSVFTGRLPTDIGGSGIEFHSAREYRTGDPLKHIDWRRFARTGELGTVDFREERAATVVLLVDARDAAYWTASAADRHAVEHGVAATGRIFATLIQHSDRVGLAAIGDDGADTVWLPPAGGRAALREARHVLATDATFRYAPPEELPELAIAPDHAPVDPSPLLARLPIDAQVVAVSPLCDDGVVAALERLEAAGHATTVVSPDATRTDTHGRRLARTQRANRLWRLRNAGIRVIDWDPATSLTETLIARQQRGGSG